MSFIEQLKKIQELLGNNSFPNEASISQGIVLPMLQEVGWNIHDPRFVMPEYSIGGSRVDFALLDRRRRPVIFVEVKALGKIDSGEEQLFNYAFHQGVPLLVLTDGKEWNFFLPEGVGSFQERKLYKLDLLERDVEIISEKFLRYLSYLDVVNGLALENAKDDLKRLTKRRDTEHAIPEAWNALIENKDEALLDLLSDKTEDICGFKPEKEQLTQFLIKLSQRNNIAETAYKSAPRVIDVERNKESLMFVRINGNIQECYSAREVMIQIITYLAKKDEKFLDNFQKVAHGKNRNYIAKDRMDLYLSNPNLCRQEGMSKEFLPGWWIGLNYSKRSIDKIIERALDCADIKKGSEVDYNLGS